MRLRETTVPPSARCSRMPCPISARTPLELFRGPPAVRAVSKAMMQKPRKVVVVSQHYPPDPSTTAAIMAAIGERVAREAEVLVLSGTAGSAAKAAAGKPAVAEVGNWMPGKAALFRR